MVELCELRMFPDEDQWPDDIDSRIAALNFGGDSVLFESFDPSVSTDSLDSQQFRERCQVKKDDFQLAFADSGHWQSGINDNLTTWGRIRTSLPLDERTASAPNVLNNSKKPPDTPTRHHQQRRPNSLIANFVSTDLTRFVDVNDNEIREADESTIEIIKKDRWRKSAAQRKSSVKRTFGDILDKKCGVGGLEAPKLDFLTMHHEMPSLCESFTASFRDAIIKTQKEQLPTITSTTDFPLYFQEDSPDSGLGCSGPSHIEDWQSLSILLPKHVVDACSFFKSNTQLLMTSSTTSKFVGSPTNCIDQTTTATSSSSRRCGISASANEACRTCYRVRRRIHPPTWAQTPHSKQILCDCATNPMNGASQLSFAPTTSTARHQLRAKELSIVGLPIYSAKRRLIENVVEGVAAISRGDGFEALVLAMKDLIEDGLQDGTSAWFMIRTLTSKGPATKDVHSIINQLEECSKNDSIKVEIFFEELIRENSLDCWLCYIVLKEKALRQLYTDDAFLAAASSEYRTLLWRMVDGLSLLPVIEARGGCRQQPSIQQWSGGASRVASDSRIPKSSSVPARLTNNQRRPSKIPLSIRRLNTVSMTSTRRINEHPASIRQAKLKNTFRNVNFEVKEGEIVKVLTIRDGLARCVRLTSSHSQLINGVIPVEHLSLL